MINNPLDDIVNCTVEISSPATNDATFNTILMIVEAPVIMENDLKKDAYQSTASTFAITGADDLLDYGYKTTDGAYKAAEVAFSQNPGPSLIQVCVRLKTGDPAKDEDIKTTLARANSEAAFYGIHITDYRINADVEAVAEWAEANEKLFGCEYTNTGACPITNTNYFRTFLTFSGLADGYSASTQPDVNKYAALAWMAKCFSYEPGSETWALKTLSTIVPSKLTAIQKTTFAGTYINTFLRYAGGNITIGGYTVGGEWIDVIRFRDWLKNEMQVNVFNVLKTNRKVPYTDAGIGLIEGAMRKTLNSGQKVGGIALTEYDSDENEIPGYTVTVPRSADLSETERRSRKLTGCKYTARLAGAIHAVEIYGYLSF